MDAQAATQAERDWIEDGLHRLLFVQGQLLHALAALFPDHLQEQVDTHHESGDPG